MYIFDDNEGKRGSPLIGNFEGIYNNISDPWGQSAVNNDEMSSFYKLSRKHLAKCLATYDVQLRTTVAEIGCGHGYVIPYIRNSFANATVDGYDISRSALETASKLNPSQRFMLSDIRKEPLPSRYDVIILSNLLWYIIDSFPSVAVNALKSVHADSNSLIVIYNAFFKEQGVHYARLSNDPARVSRIFSRLLARNQASIAASVSTIETQHSRYNSSVILLQISHSRLDK